MCFIALALEEPYLFHGPGQFASLIACSAFSLRGFGNEYEYAMSRYSLE